MQPVNIYSYRSHNYKQRIAPTFKGSEEKLIINSLDIVSPNAKKLVQCMNCYIADTWAEVKAGNYLSSTIKFSATNKSGDTLVVKPIYSANRPSVLMETYDGKYTERIIIDRQYPDNFRYERTVDTDHGHATLKSFDSHSGSNHEIEGVVNSKIEGFFPYIVPNKYLKENFGKDYKRILNMPNE